MNGLSPYDFATANDLDKFWSNTIISNSQPLILQYSNSHNNYNTNSSKFRLDKILFIELSPNLMKAIVFEKRIVLSEKAFQPSAQVRNTGSHFSCALLDKYK